MLLARDNITIPSHGLHVRVFRGGGCDGGDNIFWVLTRNHSLRVRSGWMFLKVDVFKGADTDPLIPRLYTVNISVWKLPMLSLGRHSFGCARNAKHGCEPLKPQVLPPKP